MRSLFSSPLVLIVSLLLISITPVFAFFEHLFNQQQQQQQQQQASSPSINWEEQFSSGHCPTYLCRDSLACVDKPKDCPCPYSQVDEKCLIPGSRDEGEFVCARDCKMVERAVKG